MCVNPCSSFSCSLSSIIIPYWAIETRQWNQKLESIDSSIIWFILFEYCLLDVLLLLSLNIAVVVGLHLDETIAITRFKCIHYTLHIHLSTLTFYCQMTWWFAILIWQFNSYLIHFSPSNRQNHLYHLCLRLWALVYVVYFSKFRYGQIKIDCFDLTSISQCEWWLYQFDDCF